jgi:peptidyl-prolyl cis-trans isomerase D
MLATLRKYMKQAAVVVLFGLLIISFVIWGGSGMTDSLRASVSNDVVTAGHRKVTPEMFKQDFDSQLKSLGERNQRPISQQEAIDNHLDEQLLEFIATQESELEAIRKMGITPGPQLIAAELRKQPTFFNPVTGKFDRKAYLAALAGQNLDPKTFEGELADELTIQHFNTGAAAGIKAPRAYAAFEAVFGKETRDLSYIAIDPSKVAPVGKPTDAQLTAVMNENADKLKLPEMRQLSIVRFSAKALAPTMPVDQAEIQKQFDFRKDTEAKPETRSLIQVSTKDQASANTAAARIAKGEDPQAVAKSLGGQAIPYEDKAKTGIPDPKVATVAFSLAVGQTSGAIKGDLGWSVVKVTGIAPGKEADLTTMRPQLEAAARQQAAEQKVTEEADKYDTVHNTGADMAKAAAAAGVEVMTTDPIVAQGVDMDNKPAMGVSPKLLEAAFKLPQGSESDIESDGHGEYFVVRVDKVIAPAVPALEKIRPMLEKYWTDRELQTRLKAKADEVAAQVRKGETLDAAAAAIGAKVQHETGMTREAAQAQGSPLIANLGAELVGETFDGKKGDILVAIGPQPQDPKAPANPLLFVARIDNLGQGDVTQTAQLAVQGLPSVTQTLGSELNQAIMNAARATIKPKTYPDRAKQALGITAPAAGKSKGAAG